MVAEERLDGEEKRVEVLLSVAELFLILLLGYGLVWREILPETAPKSFSNLMFYVTMPCLVLYAMSTGNASGSGDLRLALMVAFGLYGVLIGVGILLTKVVKVPVDYRGLYRFMAIFGNVGFIGFPVVIALLGQKALFYAAIYNIPFNFLVFSLGVYLISVDTEGDGKFELKKLLNPPLMATIIGLLLSVLQIQLPDFLLRTVKSLGDITTPLSLIVVGGSLVGVEIKKVLKNKIIFLFSFVKLFVVPTLVLLLFGFLKIPIMIGAVGVIMAGMPIAANAVILSQEYNGHVKEASEGVFISTLMMALSIPYLAFLISHYPIFG